MGGWSKRSKAYRRSKLAERRYRQQQLRHPWKDECPSAKIRYRTAEEAALSAKLSMAKARPYLCPGWCDGWHLTTEEGRG